MGNILVNLKVSTLNSLDFPSIQPEHNLYNLIMYSIAILLFITEDAQSSAFLPCSLYFKASRAFNFSAMAIPAQDLSSF